MSDAMKKLIRSQKAARSNARIYRQLAKETKDKKLRKALKKLAKDDKKTAGTLKKIALIKAKPNPILVRIKKELYRGLNARNLYDLTRIKRQINANRFSAMAGPDASPKIQKRLSASVIASGKHLDRMKKLMEKQ